MAAVNSVGTIKIRVESGTTTPDPDVIKRLVMLGCSEDGPLSTLQTFGSGVAARASLKEGTLTRGIEAHFAVDQSRTTITAMRLPSSTPGVLSLDTSGVTGTSVITPDGATTPLILCQPRFEILVGGDVGTPGIVYRRSADAGRTPEDVELLALTYFELPGLGVKVNLAAGTLAAGDVVVGRTTPPRWSAADLQAALLELAQGGYVFSLLALGEEVSPTEAGYVSTGLVDLLSAGRDVRAVLAARRQYPSILTEGVEVTFANANPDTITRAAGSWIADGYKVGMRVTVSESVSNNGVFVRIAAITATVLTFTSGVAFTAEAGVTVNILAEETDDDFYVNIVSEWSAVADSRLFVTLGEVRAILPSSVGSPVTDRPWPFELASKVVTGSLQTDVGQVKQNGQSGGPLVATLQGRIYEGPDRIHLDASVDDRGVVARFNVLRRMPDGRVGAFVTRGLTKCSSTDSIDTIVKARLADEWARIVRISLTDEILAPLFANAQDFNRLSTIAVQDLESAVMANLAPAFRGRASNVDAIGLNSLFSVDPNSDLSVGINCTGKIITLYYPSGFDVSLKVESPGDVS